MEIPKKKDIIDKLCKEYFDAICKLIASSLQNYDAKPKTTEGYVICLSSRNYARINIPVEIRERVEKDVVNFFMEHGGWTASFYCTSTGSYREIGIK